MLKKFDGSVSELRVDIVGIIQEFNLCICSYVSYANFSYDDDVYVCVLIFLKSR